MGADEQQLLPGLPDDVVMDCLVRVPYRFHSGLRGVCRRWRDLFTAPSFYRQRQNTATAESLVCLVQALVPTATIKEEEDTVEINGGGDEIPPTKQNNNSSSFPLSYGLTLYNATADTWHRLAAVVVPLFAQCAAVKSSSGGGAKLVLLGGWDPQTLDSVSDVHVVDLVTGRVRPGKPMSAARSFFACSAVGSTVYVAGGHDNQKNALRSAELYDVDADEWRAIPPMADERDECQGVAVGGKFWVVSGYDSESQGRFDSAAECYDPVTRRWSREEGLWGGAAAPRSACFALPAPQKEPSLWHLECGGGNRGVREYDCEEKKWKVAAGLPESLKSSPCVAVVGGGGGGERVFVVGSDGEKRHKAWVMEAESKRWSEVETPAGFTGFAYSAASIRL